MGLAKNHFEKMFARLSIQKTRNGAAVSLNLKAFGHNLDIAQDALDEQVWADMKQYMPHATGNLIRDTEELNQSTRGEVYAYDPASDYGHYQHEGTLYVDPVYNKGAFYSPGYGYWSRPGIEKIPSERELVYTDPNAVSHWDVEAYKKHKSEWVRTAKRSMK
jgi:hypothetical protein